MLNRLYEMTGGSRSRNCLASIACMLSLLAVCLVGYAWIAEPAGEAADNAVQLVRLNISAESGMVRIEITADGSLSEATIEQSTRGGKTVIRIRGARSLLRASYAIDDPVASGVRTLAGEQGGEPFVDVVIARGEGGTLAQRVNFNRLVIAIASDFARLRRRAPQTGGAEQQARATQPIKPSATETQAAATIQVESIARTDQVRSTVAPVKSSASDQARAATTTPDARPVEPKPTLVASSSSNEQTYAFRGHRIWNNLATDSTRLPRLNTRGLLPMFWQTPTASLGVTSAPIQSFMQMTLDAPGARPGVWVPGTTAAATDEIGGHIIGPGILRPSFLFGARYDDNLFYRSADGRDVTTFTVAPRLEYEIPGVNRAMRLAYEGRYRRLSLGQWANGHFLDFDTRLSLSRAFNLAFRNHFARSALDPREYDPSGEVYIVGDTFTRNDAGTRLELAINDRTRVDFDLGYNIVRWGNRFIANAPLFLDYDILSSAITLERDISPETTLLGTAFFDNTNTFVSLRPQFNGFNDNYRYGFMVGGRSQTSEAGGIALRVGYEQSEFRHAPKNNNLRTLIFDLAYRLNFRQNTNFELAALRKTQVSIFNLEGGNARLDSTGVSGRVENSPREALKLSLTLNYQRLGYPLRVVPTTTASGGVFAGDFAGRRRDEHLYGFSVEGGYRWNELLRASLVYSFMRRDSTIPVFTFNRNRISLVFEWGRRNDTRGRTF
ncbi:MAG TPA: hypothetical protein VF553_05075 [Pyrinomonadaceae bacterium]|jgi:hypothetical protein